MIVADLWREAERQLAGVGDASLGEWREKGRAAVHLRRRLSDREQRSIGPAVDVRGTPEALQRAMRLPDQLRAILPASAFAEVGPQ